MSKVFVLFHGFDCEEAIFENELMNVDKREIGFFYAKEECLKVLEHCKQQPGFENYPDGFYIEEFYLDSLYNEPLNFLKEVLVGKGKDCPRELYTLSYEKEYKDLPLDFGKLLGLFTTKKKAESAKKILLSEPMLKDAGENLWIQSTDVKHIAWLDGFIWD